MFEIGTFEIETIGEILRKAKCCMGCHHVGSVDNSVTVGYYGSGKKKLPVD
jgi:hypothetical protein